MFFVVLWIALTLYVLWLKWDEARLLREVQRLRQSVQEDLVSVKDTFPGEPCRVVDWDREDFDVYMGRVWTCSSCSTGPYCSPCASLRNHRPCSDAFR